MRMTCTRVFPPNPQQTCCKKTKELLLFEDTKIGGFFVVLLQYNFVCLTAVGSFTVLTRRKIQISKLEKHDR